MLWYQVEECVVGALPNVLVAKVMFASILQYQELLLASYNTNPETPHEPDGVCLVWNSLFKKDSPEYIFHCQVKRDFWFF